MNQTNLDMDIQIGDLLDLMSVNSCNTERSLLGEV